MPNTSKLNGLEVENHSFVGWNHPRWSRVAVTLRVMTISLV